MKKHYLITSLFIQIIISSCKASGVINLGNILKPPNDEKEYRGIVLPNELKAILVSDPKTQKAAAALTVPAGALNDPLEFQGLAHFVEHALFCFGNEKFPEENGYYNFLSRSGGDANAWTDLALTTYFFHVAPSALRSSLERHAAMFISPLFPESALEREVKAVDSEHQKNIPNEGRRELRVESLTAKEGHPFTQFTTGSLKTLWTRPIQKGLNLRSATLEFFDQHYSSNLMYLSVYGSESLDDLEAMVLDLFNPIPNRNKSMQIWEDNPVKASLQERIDILPLEDTKTLKLVFPIQYIQEIYKTSALEYIKYLLNLEGEGSLHNLLVKNKKWVETFSTVPIGFASGSSRGFTNFAVDFTLTKSGAEVVDKVILYLFKYLEMLREERPQKWLWEEIRKIARIKQRFQDRVKPDNLVTNLAVNLMSYPIEKILYAYSVDETASFDGEGITKLLSELVPQNVRMMVTCKACGKETEWKYEEEFYGIKYNRKKIDEEIINEWINCKPHDDFFLPQRNDMIPSNFDLKARDDQSIRYPLRPLTLVQNDFSTLWYLQDTQFLLPKAVVTVELYSAIVNIDPISVNLNSLFASWIIKSTWKFRRTANLAGLDVGVGAPSYGLKFIISGYDDKLATFLSKIFHQVVNFTPDPDLFETVKESRIKYLKNKRSQEPADVIQAELNRLLQDHRWTTAELLEEMHDLTLEDLTYFVQEVLSNFSITWLFYGNLTPDESKKMAADTEKLFKSKWKTRPLLPSQMVQARMIELPPGSNYMYRTNHPTHSSSATTVLFQVEADSLMEVVILKMFVRIVEVPCFNQLRTKEQLGYAATADVLASDETHTTYFRILVQGTPHPHYVESRIDSFLKDFGETLNSMTDEEFELRKSAELDVHSMKPSTMAERVGRIFREIHQESLNFERERLEIVLLQRLVLPDLQHFFEDRIANPLTRRRLVIHVISTKDGENSVPKVSNNEEIVNVVTWKEEMYFLPNVEVNHRNFT